MIRAVLDTNVLASGFVGESKQSSSPGRIILLWRRGAFRLVLSDVILGELARTFRDRYFFEKLGDTHGTANLRLLQSRAEIVRVDATVRGVASHPEDDLILATAVSAKADYLVTCDGQLLKLGTYESVTILSPRAFLDLLDSTSQDIR